MNHGNNTTPSASPGIKDNRQILTTNLKCITKTDIAKLKARNDSDFIERNRVKALTMAPPSLDKVEELAKYDEYGRVPAYLEERKAQWEEEKEERRKLQVQILIVPRV